MVDAPGKIIIIFKILVTLMKIMSIVHSIFKNVTESVIFRFSAEDFITIRIYH